MPEVYNPPASFLDIRVHQLLIPCGITGMCAGYELEEWRYEQLASHLMEWLPEFALDYSELEALGPGNAVALINKAAYEIYTSPSYKNRGEIGELLLHIGIRQVFNSIPVISKYYYKDANNDTVKGFDAVHVVGTQTGLELWLGEVKFYKDIKRAVRDVIEEIKTHTQRDYLRSEFVAITNKINPEWPHADKLTKLLDKNTSLDEVFDNLAIPVFLTYESPTINAHTSVTDEFQQAFEEEVAEHHDYFISNLPDVSFKLHLFLLPMQLKQSLQNAFDERLRACQALAPR